MIAAFRFEEDRIQYYTFLFPLAIGTLKQLLAGELGKPSNGFWVQFKGLASAVEYLHNELIQLIWISKAPTYFCSEIPKSQASLLRSRILDLLSIRILNLGYLVPRKANRH